MSKLFIFDFFGVLSGEIANRFCFNHFSKDIAMKKKEGYFLKADIGESTFEDILQQMTKDLNINYNDILQEFKNYGVLNTELFEYILKLKNNKNNHVALLSNAPKDLHKLLYPNIDLNKYFEKIYISGQQGISKPDLKFYEICVKSFGQDFEEIYMIDDSEKNLKNLDKLNIKSILFKSNEELFKILDKYL